MKNSILLALLFSCARVQHPAPPDAYEDTPIGSDARNVRDDDPALGRDEQIEQRPTGDEATEPKEDANRPNPVDAEPTPAAPE